MMPAPVFATTVHDPDGRFVSVLEAVGGMLERYPAAHFVCTEMTHARLIDVLRRFGDVVLDEPGRIGHSRRIALTSALNEGGDAILYCDFDRWLHWAHRHPAGLAAVPSLVSHAAPDTWYVCLGRTARAFATHPPAQRYTEELSNRVLSVLLRREVDATAGAAWMTARGARVILAGSRESTNATDLEWPALIVQRGDGRLGYLATEGLEFESATFYPDEVAASGGLEAWIDRRYGHPEAWRARVGLMNQSIEAAFRVFHARSAASG